MALHSACGFRVLQVAVDGLGLKAGEGTYALAFNCKCQLTSTSLEHLEGIAAEADFTTNHLL